MAALWEELSHQQPENPHFVTHTPTPGYAKVTQKSPETRMDTGCNPCNLVTSSNGDAGERLRKSAPTEFSMPKSLTPTAGGGDYGSHQKSPKSQQDAARGQQQYHPLTAQDVDHARAYHAHHFQCPQCISAGRGTGYGSRCDAGLVLWDAYNGAT